MKSYSLVFSLLFIGHNIVAQGGGLDGHYSGPLESHRIFAQAKIKLQKPGRIQQFENGFPSDLIYTPRGTGQTTGHIITLNIENPTGQSFIIPETPVIVPATPYEGGFRQAHKGVVPATTIEAYTSQDVNIYGHCLDISLLPVDDGEKSIDVSQYITHENMGAPLDPFFNTEDEYDIPAWNEIDEELQKLIDKYDPDKKEDPYAGVDQSTIDMLDSFKKLMDAEKFVQELADRQKRLCENQNDEHYDPMRAQLEEDWDKMEKELQDLADKYNPDINNDSAENNEVSEEVLDALDSYERLNAAEKAIKALRQKQESDCEEKTKEEDYDYDYEAIEKNAQEDLEAVMDELKGLAEKYDPSYNPDPYEGVSQDVIDMLDSYKKLCEVEEYLLKLKAWQEQKRESNKIHPSLRNYYLPENQPYIVYPGTDEVFPYKIDLRGDLKTIAPVIFDIDERVDRSFEKALEEGKLDHLPLPKAQLEAELPQQVKWRVYALLADNTEYSEADMLENTFTQIETKLEQTRETLGEDITKEVKTGVSNIWASLNYIGTDAKVMKERKTDVKFSNNRSLDLAVHSIRDILNNALEYSIRYNPPEGIIMTPGQYGITARETTAIIEYMLDSGFSKEIIKEALQSDNIRADMRDIMMKALAKAEQ